MQAVIALLFKILLRLVPIFFRSLEEKTSLKKKVVDAIREHEYKHSTELASAREADAALEAQLKREWIEKWGTEEGAPTVSPSLPPPPLPLVEKAVLKENEAWFSAPASVRAGQEFWCEFGSKIPLGSVVRCGTSQLALFLGEKKVALCLTGIGERKLDVVFEGDILETVVVKVTP